MSLCLSRSTSQQLRADLQRRPGGPERALNCCGDLPSCVRADLGLEPLRAREVHQPSLSGLSSGHLSDSFTFAGCRYRGETNEKGRACLWTGAGPWGTFSGRTRDGDTLWFIVLDCALDVPARAERWVARCPSDIQPSIALRSRVPGRLKTHSRVELMGAHWWASSVLSLASVSWCLRWYVPHPELILDSEI